MSKILFLSREFAQENNACGICMLNLADEFVRRGYVVYVLSLKAKPQPKPFDLHGIRIIEIKENWFTSFNTRLKKKSGFFDRFIFRVIQIIRLLITIPLYPRVSRKQERILYKKAEELINEYHIEYILGSFSPCETAYVPIKLKKKYPLITVVNYHLDPILIPDNNSECVNLYKIYKGKKFVAEELNVIDKLLAPESTSGIVENDKINYVGFPLFLEKLQITDSGFRKEDNEISIVYIGTLDKSNRNIEFTVNLLETINRNLGNRIKLHIWGTLLDYETKQIIQKSNIVMYHGTIDNKYVPDLLTKADFILNVSNFNSYNAIPSKIFQSFSTRKPIINIVRHPKDFAVRYFDNYPAALSIPEYDEDVSLNNIIDFINLNIGKQVTLAEDAFSTCRPAYICDLIVYSNEKA